MKAQTISELDSLNDERDILISTIADLQGEIADLESDLQEANDALWDVDQRIQELDDNDTARRDFERSVYEQCDKEDANETA